MQSITNQLAASTLNATSSSSASASVAMLATATPVDAGPTMASELPTEVVPEGRGRRAPKVRNPYFCRASQREPRWDRILPGEPLAFDDEFQRYLKDQSIWDPLEWTDANGKWHHRHGRVAVVNSIGEVVLDVFVYYRREEGIRKAMNPKQFGVEWEDLLKDNGARAAEAVERELQRIFKGHTIVVHGGTHDLTSFYIEKNAFAESRVVDTQKLYAAALGRSQPGLKDCSARYLSQSIQQSAHCPVEDARATMELYLRLHPYDRVAEAAKVSARRQYGGHAGNVNGKRGGQWR